MHPRMLPVWITMDNTGTGDLLWHMQGGGFQGLVISCGTYKEVASKVCQVVVELVTTCTRGLNSDRNTKWLCSKKLYLDLFLSSAEAATKAGPLGKAQRYQGRWHPTSAIAIAPQDI